VFYFPTLETLYSVTRGNVTGDPFYHPSPAFQQRSSNMGRPEMKLPFSLPLTE